MHVSSWFKHFPICLEDFAYFWLSSLQSICRCAWHPKLNQIVVGCANGKAKVYFSPKYSLRWVEGGREGGGGREGREGGGVGREGRREGGREGGCAGREGGSGSEAGSGREGGGCGVGAIEGEEREGKDREGECGEEKMGGWEEGRKEGGKKYHHIDWLITEEQSWALSRRRERRR